MVAAKVLGRHTGALLARFWREQEVRLRHPHLVTATGWAAEEDIVLLVTDLVRGGTVQDLLLDHGPLPDGVVAAVMRQTLQALAAVHAAGLVHRDVKPDNLLLEATEDGSVHVRLSDFGVALDTRAPRLTVTGPVGTASYLPPETGGFPDDAHDLWAVGVLGVHLLTGRPPHPDLPLPASRLTGVLDVLLTDDPGRRPSASGALSLVERLGVPEEPGPWVHDRLPPLPARHDSSRGEVARRWLVLVGCLVLLGVSGVALVWCAATWFSILTGDVLPSPFLDW